MLGHQGDVQFMRINKIPKDFEKAKSKTFFAKSERSGHVHALCGDYELYTNPKNPSEFIVVVGKDGAVLNHTLFTNTAFEGFFDKTQATKVADHRPSFFKPGIYRVGIQKRIDPLRKPITLFDRIRNRMSALLGKITYKQVNVTAVDVAD